MSLTNKIRVYATTGMITVGGLITTLGAPWKWR